MEFKQNSTLQTMYPNNKRIGKQSCTIQFINNVFAADEKIREADSLPATPSGVRNESSIHIECRLNGGKKKIQ